MYYTENGYAIEEVTVINREGNKLLIKDKKGSTFLVPEYKCYNSKDEIVAKVLDNLEYDVQQAKWDINQAQEDLEMAQEKNQKYLNKSMYNKAYYIRLV